MFDRKPVLHSSCYALSPYCPCSYATPRRHCATLSPLTRWSRMSTSSSVLGNRSTNYCPLRFFRGAVTRPKTATDKTPISESTIGPLSEKGAGMPHGPEPGPESKHLPPLVLALQPDGIARLETVGEAFPDGAGPDDKRPDGSLSHHAGARTSPSTRRPA